ncbi:MAG: cytochrome ubiquinol oxidase subunit I [Anaerolineales bacterium]|nr:cytochrome ubiquinol oxidase subunit I [Anaerolineae bacterium]PWB54118.1 MAG: cytochrome ubiquinol oxidase subunit I [Anaerolineales bacterium]
MNVLLLARLQFAITIIYHFFFVPLTLGLSLMVAIFESIYVATGKETYKRLTKFWGKLFLINFAIGVVTGIVQEFQFGMSWSEYSRFVGDIFGAPLAIEALLAFFLESTFLGIWIFGWDRISKGLHLATIWLVVVGSTISAMWILVANAFMQHPVGYTIEDGRAVLTNFWEVVTNLPIFSHFPHVLSAGLVTASFFMMGVSAYHLIRHNETELFRISIRLASAVGLVATIAVGLSGHTQGQELLVTQPMKLASLEALYNTEDPASLSIITIGNPVTREVLLDWRVPGLLSFMEYNRFTGKVEGILDLEQQYIQQYGPGDYVPPPYILYWSFRAMVGAGLLMILISLVALFIELKNLYAKLGWFIKILPFAVALPYIANTTGWILTEVGRFPWTVYRVLKLPDSVSLALSGGEILISLIGFILVYGLLITATVYLMMKFAKAGPVLTSESPAEFNPSLVAPSEGK